MTNQSQVNQLKETLEEIKYLAEQKTQYAFAKNIVRKCEKAIENCVRLQDEAVPSPSESPKEAVETSPTRRGDFRTHADRQDKDSRGLCVLLRTERPHRLRTSSGTSLRIERVEETDRHTLTVYVTT